MKIDEYDTIREVSLWRLHNESLNETKYFGKRYRSTPWIYFQY